MKKDKVTIFEKMLIVKMPKRIDWLDKQYQLFIYFEMGHWSATYAIPEYFCENCGEKYDPIMIYDTYGNTIEEALEKLLARVQKIAEQEKEMKFLY